MKGKGMVGLGRVVLAKRERPIILEPFGKGMRGMTLRYAYEVRDEKDYFSDIPDVKIPAEMLKLAEHILDTKAADFDPNQFEDSYENAVIELLRQKQAGKVVKGKAEPRRAGNVVNLMDALKKSLSESKGGSRKTVTAPPLAPAMPKAKKRARA
jgi:DNA end-binding protein Ku